MMMKPTNTPPETAVTSAKYLFVDLENLAFIAGSLQVIVLWSSEHTARQTIHGRTEPRTGPGAARRRQLTLE